MIFSLELVQLDIMNPEYFQYRVFAEDNFVTAFNSLEEANAFIVDHGGDPQSVVKWVKGIQATAGSTYR